MLSEPRMIQVMIHSPFACFLCIVIASQLLIVFLKGIYLFIDCLIVDLHVMKLTLFALHVTLIFQSAVCY